ncbi:unnamed protein product [Allacma fusca]|uniref:Cyclase n=1 Tax=Allacma fusca TaxID=39272 RepID=A0A8J2PAW9_9HEXA|nr:unnamed protein product [Allacma fusca]
MKVVILILAFCSYSNSKYVDLTYALNKETILWPGRHISFNTEIEKKLPDGSWLASKGFCISEHTSTHMDAPYHFNELGWTLDKFPIDTFMDLPGVCIDIYDKVHRYEGGELRTVSNYVLTKEDILEWEGKNGAIPAGALVLVRTGWGKRWPNRNEYYGLPLELRTTTEKSADANPKNSTVDLESPEASNLNFPGFDASAALFLTSERQINGAGIDTLSMDAGNAKTFPAHKIFLKRRIFLIENAANLHLLPAKGFTLFAIPFKVDAGTGAPTRLIAKLPDEKNNL